VLDEPWRVRRWGWDLTRVGHEYERSHGASLPVVDRLT